jgi:hypothetical protein
MQNQNNRILYTFNGKFMNVSYYDRLYEPQQIKVNSSPYGRPIPPFTDYGTWYDIVAFILDPYTYNVTSVIYYANYKEKSYVSVNYFNVEYRPKP